MELQAIRDAFMKHEREDTERFASVGSQLADIHREQINLKENHWAHTQTAVEDSAKSIKAIELALAKNTNDTGWILRLLAPIGAAIVAAVIGLAVVMLRKGAGL